MNTRKHRCRPMRLFSLASVVTCLAVAGLARADIFRWDDGQLIPGTEGITPGPGVNLHGGCGFFGGCEPLNLRFADFSGGLDLTQASFYRSWLDNSRFNGAILTNADLSGTTLTNANFAGAMVAGANFGIGESSTATGITLPQLSSTVSYQQRNLRGIGIGGHDLTGWDFSGQDLAGADFGGSMLTSANFAGAVVAGAHFDDGYAGYYDVRSGSGITLPQLYSTASYQQRDLRGIGLGVHDLTGWDFSGQDLTGANFVWSMLTNANFAGAVVSGARFTLSPGFTKEQLYSTASYQQRNLASIGLSSNDLTDWDFSGQDLTSADLGGSTLTNANLAGAMVTGATFVSVTSRGFTKEQLYSTASYQQRNLGSMGLSYNNLAGWDFSGQDLSGANLYGATLANSNLSGANLTNTNLNTANLTNADLTGADARGSWLNNARLNGADLTRANLFGARLSGANLAGAVVAGANFGAAVGFGAGFPPEQLYSTASYQQRNLRRIGLSNNNLTDVNFSGQDLTGAEFTGSLLWNAKLSFADTRGAIGLNLTDAITTNLIRPDGRIIGLNLSAGAKLVAYAGVSIPVQVSGGFSIAPTAKFDLTDNAAIVDYAGTSPAAMVREHIISGRGGSGLGGDWTGTGITSSTAAAANETASDSRSLGYADNATLPLGAYTSFHGAAVDSTAVFIAFTRTGDANLDGVVNDDDVTIVGATYSPSVPQPSWALGDFDYNGFVDDDDVTLLNAFYDPTAPPLIAAAPTNAVNGPGVAAVPEPSTAILFLAALTLAVPASLKRLSRFFRDGAVEKLFAVACAITLFHDSPALAQIYRRDNGELIPGTQGITPGPGVRLDYLDLECADLSGCDLSGASFVGSSLKRASLSKANLARSDLAGACVDSANLINADLSGADLTGTSFRRSILTKANLLDAVVTNADFRLAAFSGFTIEQAYPVSRRAEEAMDRLSARDQLHAADRVLAAGWTIVPFDRGRQLRLGLGLRPDDQREKSLW